MSDAGFHDADPGPLALMVQDAEDLLVVSALLQDGILTGADITYDTQRRFLALLVNRFRWEDADQARRQSRPYERVRAVLMISDVMRVQSDGIARGDKDLVLELLNITWQPGEDGAGQVVLQFSGDGTLALDVECLNIDVRDVTQPYLALSRMEPGHPD